MQKYFTAFIPGTANFVFCIFLPSIRLERVALCPTGPASDQKRQDTDRLSGRTAGSPDGQAHGAYFLNPGPLAPFPTLPA
jgi:hypothetical protein